MPARKPYVGDGVYVEFDDYGAIHLTTENGLAVTNRIVLEPEVWARLVELVQNRRDAARIGTCDGNHRAPMCDDPECWQRLTDADLRNLQRVAK